MCNFMNIIWNNVREYYLNSSICLLSKWAAYLFTTYGWESFVALWIEYFIIHKVKILRVLQEIFDYKYPNVWVSVFLKLSDLLSHLMLWPKPRNLVSLEPWFRLLPCAQNVGWSPVHPWLHAPLFYLHLMINNFPRTWVELQLSFNESTIITSRSAWQCKQMLLSHFPGLSCITAPFMD